MGTGGQRTGLRGPVAPILADFGEVNGHNHDRLLSWAIAEVLSRRVLGTLSGKKKKLTKDISETERYSSRVRGGEKGEGERQG